jgi:hypothetical protein
MLPDHARERDGKGATRQPSLHEGIPSTEKAIKCVYLLKRSQATECGQPGYVIVVCTHPNPYAMRYILPDYVREEVTKIVRPDNPRPVLADCIIGWLSGLRHLGLGPLSGVTRPGLPVWGNPSGGVLA